MVRERSEGDDELLLGHAIVNKRRHLQRHFFSMTQRTNGKDFEIDRGVEELLEGAS